MKILEELKKHTNVDKEIEKFLLEECDRKIYQKGELLSKQSQYNNTVFFVEEGLLRMFYYENGKDITSNFYSEGKITDNIDTIFKKYATSSTFRKEFDSFDENSLDERSLKFLLLDLYKLPDVKEDYEILCNRFDEDKLEPKYKEFLAKYIENYFNFNAISWGE